VPTQYEFDITSEVDLAILTPLIRSLDRLSGLAPPRQVIQRVSAPGRLSSIFQDIIVHASQELIDGSSSVRTLLMDLEESCSICQDRMRQGENIRRLNACQHEFHVACVDNWFLQRSVLCPVCRHDIRDPTPALRSPTLTANETVPAVPAASLYENNEETEEDSDETPRSRLRSRANINNMFNRRLE